jgi:hypothetical protein
MTVQKTKKGEGSMPPARPRVLLNQMNQIIAALVGVDTLPDEFCDGPPLREVDAEQWAHTSLVDRVAWLCGRLWNSTDTVPAQTWDEVRLLADELDIDPPASRTYAAVARWLRKQLTNDELRDEFARWLVRAAGDQE